MSQQPHPGYAGYYSRRAWRGPQGAAMRIGDAERNEVIEALGRHFSDGRLDDAELHERLDRATKAKTGADLAGLLADLPPLGPTTPELAHRRPTGLWVVLALLVVGFSLPWQLLGWQWMWFPRVPWLLVGVVALALWRRSRHRHPPRI